MLTTLVLANRSIPQPSSPPQRSSSPIEKYTPSMQLTPQASPSPYSTINHAREATATKVLISHAFSAPQHAAAAILPNIVAPIV